MSRTALRTKVLADIREALTNKLGFFHRQLERANDIQNAALRHEVIAYAEAFIFETNRILETLS